MNVRRWEVVLVVTTLKEGPRESIAARCFFRFGARLFRCWATPVPWPILVACQQWSSLWPEDRVTDIKLDIRKRAA